jgi:hypothetical protein
MANDDAELFARDLKRIDDIGSVVFTVCMAAAVSGGAVAFAVSDSGQRIALSVVSVILGVAAMLAVPDCVLGNQRGMTHKQYLAKRIGHVFIAQMTLLWAVMGAAAYGFFRGIGAPRPVAVAGAGGLMALACWVGTVMERRDIREIRDGAELGAGEKAAGSTVNLNG